MENKVIAKEYVDKNYIHKDKIREKIDEIDGEVNIADIPRELYNRKEYAIEVLIELLEDK